MASNDFTFLFMIPPRISMVVKESKSVFSRPVCVDASMTSLLPNRILHLTATESERSILSTGWGVDSCCSFYTGQIVLQYTLLAYLYYLRRAHQFQHSKFHFGSTSKMESIAIDSTIGL